MSAEDAWEALEKADEKRDLDDFREVRADKSIDDPTNRILTFPIRLFEFTPKPLRMLRMMSSRQHFVSTTLIPTSSLPRTNCPRLTRMSIFKVSLTKHTKSASTSVQSPSARLRNKDGQRAPKRILSASRMQACLWNAEFQSAYDVMVHHRRPFMLGLANESP